MLYLASQSPRRRELLGMLDLPFEVMRIEGVEEVWPEGLLVSEVPEYLARLKGEAVRSQLSDDDVVLSADTVVINDGRIYGKPHTEEEAVNMLMSLVGHTHQVTTGVAITSKEKIRSFTVTTDVTFAEIKREEAEYYVRKYKPMDKAGAYGIQEWIGCIAVESINGSFYNVMGLPVQRLYRELSNF